VRRQQGGTPNCYSTKPRFKVTLSVLVLEILFAFFSFFVAFLVAIWILFGLDRPLGGWAPF
jgi:hypothetical protein